MERSLKKALAASVLMGMISFPLFAAQTYQIDPLHTYVLWHINHFGFSNPSGKWLANGEILLDQDKLEHSKVSVTIDVGKMITGIEELDKHMRGKGFFDVAQFPNATFVSEKIEVINHQIKKVHGKLTLKGITKPVILDVKLNKMGKSIINERETIGYSAHTTIKRSDFGITTGLPELGDEIKLDIELEAFVPEGKK